jgi:5'-nucleotidase (lipoprotein e(P4) family)
MKKFTIVIVFFIASCTIAPRVTVSNVGNNNSGMITGGKLYTTAYQQNAAEYRALCLQGFNIARQRVDEIILAKTEKPKAIVTDIDETILDNSPYEAHQVLQGKDYESSSWYEWTSTANADTVPGAAAFLKYASSRGLEIFYVTNRSEKERNATIKNLQKFNLPNSDDAHLLLMKTTSSKEERRKNVAATHNIVMLIGDNLADVSPLFDKKNTGERLQAVNNIAEDFGDKFIIIPNPVYGDWESALYNYNYSLSAVQKDSSMKASLHTY